MKLTYPRLKDKGWLVQKFCVEDMTVRELAELEVCSMPTVEKRLQQFEVRKYGEKRVHKGIDKSAFCKNPVKYLLLKNRDFLFEQRVVQGRTYEEIAKTVGCEKTSIIHWCKKHEIPPFEKERTCEERMRYSMKRFYDKHPEAVEAQRRFSKVYCSTHINTMLGTHHSDETKKKISLANKGKLVGRLNPGYIDGRSAQSYPSDEWKKTLKLSIRQRDSFKCQLCGIRSTKNIGVCRHIILIMTRRIATQQI